MKNDKYIFLAIPNEVLEESDVSVSRPLQLYADGNRIIIENIPQEDLEEEFLEYLMEQYVGGDKQ